MSTNKLLEKAKIKQSRDRWCNASVVACFVGIGVIVLSPSIPVTAGALVVAGGIELLGLKKIRALNEKEKNL